MAAFDNNDINSTTLSGQSKKVFVVSSHGDLALLKCSTTLRNCNLLSFDCEGVDLGRNGEISIVQLGTPNECFLFDILHANKNSKIVLFLKNILEDTKIIKIIHDCKMDSDALYHILGIQLSSCHDTQAWDKVFLQQCEKKSDDRICFLRDKVCRQSQIDPSKMPRFIGKGGSNIKSLCEGSNHFFQTTGSHNLGKVDVYSSPSSIEIAMRKLVPYQKRSVARSNRIPTSTAEDYYF